MKTKTISFGLMCCLLLSFSSSKVCGQYLHAQVLNSTGNYTQLQGYLLDYSVGEMTVVETAQFSGGLLTQGFLQPLLLPATGTGGVDIKVFPDVSPNNDGQGHEHLEIEHIENYPDNDIKIFNRWGNLIYTQSGYDNGEKSFKGKANTGLLVDGAEVPDGTYYYILKVFDPVTGKTQLFNGFFVIKRK